MQYNINEEITFLRSIISSKYTISNLSVDADDTNLFVCVIEYNNCKCIISYLKGYDIYLLTTNRYINNKVLTFEYEFWFKDYSNEKQKIKFNDIIADFTNDSSDILLDKGYACQIVYK